MSGMLADSRKGAGPLAIVVLSLTLLVHPVHAADPVNGKKKYLQQCAMCHGKNGSPVMPDAADFRKGDGLFKSDQALMSRIQDGGDACPGYWGILKEKEILDVISYLRTLY